MPDDLPEALSREIRDTRSPVRATQLDALVTLGFLYEYSNRRVDHRNAPGFYKEWLPSDLLDLAFDDHLQGLVATDLIDLLRTTTSEELRLAVMMAFQCARPHHVLAGVFHFFLETWQSLTVEEIDRFLNLVDHQLDWRSQEIDAQSIAVLRTSKQFAQIRQELHSRGDPVLAGRLANLEMSIART